jgi:alkylhydroperoxidase family enzyme
MGRYDELVENQRRAVLESQGVTERPLRRAVAARAAALGGGPVSEEASAEIPETLRAYVDSIALHAYRITDEDLEALRRSGRSEDEIFEVSVAAAVGAGLARLKRGLAALKGEKP